MASGDLFRGFSVRFSLKKRQHVEMLQKFEDNRLNKGKVKNQIIMDALEMYYNALENGNNTEGNRAVTESFIEQRLVQLKQEIKGEIMRELLGIFISSRMAGQSAATPSSIVKAKVAETVEDGVADISEMPDVMEKLMDWSEN